MRSILYFLFLIPSQGLFSQNFTEFSQKNMLDGVRDCAIAFADINGDNHQDLIITGQTTTERITKLYTNDGIGNFTEMLESPFEPVDNSSVAFADVNGDSHQDLLIIGKDNSFDDITKLYINDGTGNFTEMSNAPFEGASFGSIAFADVNGDNHQDILITGGQGTVETIAKLYINDGTGNFTELSSVPFEGVRQGSVAFADVNGDSHLDVLITGQKRSLDRSAQLYINDGIGNFTELLGTPFDPVWSSAIAFADVNGDNHQDVLITGATGITGNNPIAKLYINDGMANFTEMLGTPFESILTGSIAFADVNNDGNQDVLISGTKDQLRNEIITKLYTNDGLGNYTDILDTPFDSVWTSSIAFVDINKDDYLDVFIAGSKDASSMERIAKLYTNDGILNSINTSKKESIFELFAFPNPASVSTIFVNHTEALVGEAIINIYTENGILLKQLKIFLSEEQKKIQLDTNSLNSGTYFVELLNGKKRGTTKIIVQ